VPSERLPCYKGNFYHKFPRYFKKKFTNDRKETIGVECYDKNEVIDNKNFAIKFWDTAGQEKFAVTSRSYYQIAHGIILTVAINNRDSFINLKKWLHSIKDNNKNDNIQMIVVGSKCDLAEERVVKKEELKAQADELKVELFETSAKENFGIEEAFDCIVQKVFNSIYNNNSKKDDSIDKKDAFKLEPEDNKGSSVSGKKKCCS
jgi:Ras-related protein Rab-1A